MGHPEKPSYVGILYHGENIGRSEGLKAKPARSNMFPPSTYSNTCSFAKGRTVGLRDLSGTVPFA